MWFITGWRWPFGKNSVLYSLGGGPGWHGGHQSPLPPLQLLHEERVSVSLSLSQGSSPVSFFIKNWIMAAWQHENTLDRDNPWPSPSLWRMHIHIYMYSYSSEKYLSCSVYEESSHIGQMVFLFFHQWDGVLGLWSYKRDDHDDAKGEETKESLSKNTRCSARLTFKNPLRFWFKPTVFWF